MKILIFTCEFAPFPGGVGSFNRDLVLALSRLGHDVTVVTRDYSSTLPKEQDALDPSFPTNVEIIRQLWPHPMGFFTMPFRLKSFLLKRREEFDLFLITSSKAHAIASKVSPRILGPYEIVVHGDEIHRHFSPDRGRLALLYRSRPVRRLFNDARHVLGISRDTVKKLAYYGFSSRNLFLGVDERDFFPVEDVSHLYHLRRDFNVEAGVPVVVSAGRLELAKGFDKLITAFSRLSADIPGACLLIAGDGKDREKLQSLAKNSGASSDIRFLGRLERSRLRELLQISNFFALVSRHENFGLVFLEASACRKAVIGSYVGGVPEAVADGVSGVLVDPTSVEEIESALRKLLLDEAYCKKLGEHGFRRFINGFTSLHMAEEIVKVTSC